MSMLNAYKNIVSRVYKLSQLSYQHKDTTDEFDDFLEHLQVAFELKKNDHIPPHVEILDLPAENVVVVKDDTIKNIALRHTNNISINEDEQNELIPESIITEIDDKDDTVNIPDASLFVEDDAIPTTTTDDDDRNIAAAAIQSTLDDFVNVIGDQTSVCSSENDDTDEEADNDLYTRVYMGMKYHVSDESKRVYQYIDDETRGPMVGKLENGKIVLL